VSIVVTESLSALATMTLLPCTISAFGSRPVSNVLTCWLLVRSTSDTVPVAGISSPVLVTIAVP
jgi:hypothetical protein